MHIKTLKYLLHGEVEHSSFLTDPDSPFPTWATPYLTAIRETRYCTKQHVIVLVSSTDPTEKHLKEVKQIFRHLKNTIHMGLWYPKDTGFELTAFSDSDHAGCLDIRKSTSGGIKFLGGDKLVSWSSKKQDCTLMSQTSQKPE
ncbi:hypothetical protein Tco_1121527 [Tanacetum coccineum]|uniref:Uncharacterized protein n=1 Tax=Tanacetum coccineum TaxID=301880 RepID=A0ABQ5IXY1_9ASTR